MLHGKKNVRNKRPCINNAEVSNLVWQNHKRNVTVKHPQNMEGCFYHLKNAYKQNIWLIISKYRHQLFSENVEILRQKI